MALDARIATLARVGLGDFDITSLIEPTLKFVLPTAINSGAAIGAAVITAEANKTAAAKSAAANTLIALSQERLGLATQAAETERTRISAQSDGTLKLVLVVGGLALAAVLLVVYLRGSRAR
jgi:hypothetical protein